MVHLEEIKDEDDLQTQDGPEDDGDFTDTGLPPTSSTPFLLYNITFCIIVS